MDSAQLSLNLIPSDSLTLPSNAPVFQAEVEAINQGARFALHIIKPTQRNMSLFGDLRPYELCFIGDNRASIYAISNHLATSQIVLNCTKT